MRIIDTLEMSELWKEIEPYIDKTLRAGIDSERLEKGDIYIYGTPEEIKEKHKRYRKLFSKRYDEAEKWINSIEIRFVNKGIRGV